MKSNFIKQRVGSVLLLLVFFQQIGAGLYLHNLLHDKEQTVQTSRDANVSGKENIITCSCVDNFLMPFLDADIAVSLEPFQLHIKPVDSFSEKAYFTSLIFSSLRGPPGI
jgi:hypothetical protein